MTKKESKLNKQTTAATKSQKIIGLLNRANGASITELAKATDWQDHSVRGFMSGNLKKKLGLKIVSTRDHGDDRRYFIKPRAGVAS